MHWLPGGPDLHRRPGRRQGSDSMWRLGQEAVVFAWLCGAGRVRDSLMQYDGPHCLLGLASIFGHVRSISVFPVSSVDRESKLIFTTQDRTKHQICGLRFSRLWYRFIRFRFSVLGLFAHPQGGHQSPFFLFYQDYLYQYNSCTSLVP